MNLSPRWNATAALPVDKERVKAATLALIRAVGEDPEREGLRDTPARIAAAYEELLKGYAEDPKNILRVEFNESSGIVLEKNIDFYSMCEHHFLPFYGRAHIGYLPAGKVVGVSKLARVVECYSRRLQLQERMTKQIADSIFEILKPRGVMVVTEATHLCMEIRGAKTKANVVVSEIRGNFANSETREEFFNLLRGS